MQTLAEGYVDQSHIDQGDVQDAATPVDGEIRGNVAYTLHEFKLRTGLGRQAMKHAREKGLPVRYVGRCAYVLGSEWLEFVRSAGRLEK